VGAIAKGPDLFDEVWANFVPKTMVPKVRVELTQSHPHRFLSLVRVVLISVIRRDLVQAPEYFPANVRA